MNLPHIKLHSQFLMWPSNNNEIRPKKPPHKPNKYIASTCHIKTCRLMAGFYTVTVPMSQLPRLLWVNDNGY